MPANPSLAPFCKHNILEVTPQGTVCKFCGTYVAERNPTTPLTHKRVLNNQVPAPPQPQIRGMNNPTLCAHDYSDKGTYYQCSKCSSTIPKSNCGCGG